ncbi:MAG: hypothetical protein WCC81_25390, partial [Pseudolabrys sp.]
TADLIADKINSFAQAGAVVRLCSACAVANMFMVLILPFPGGLAAGDFFGFNKKPRTRRGILTHNDAELGPATCVSGLPDL